MVALAGDTVAIRDGHVIRNGRRADEPFAARCGGTDGCDLPEAITVPPGTVYLLGDNRGNFARQPLLGSRPDPWVIGEARAAYWPPGRVGTL